MSVVHSYQRLAAHACTILLTICPPPRYTYPTRLSAIEPLRLLLRIGWYREVSLESRLMSESNQSFIRFLWLCAGAKPEILARPECSTETPKYTVIGTMILLTAAFAAISAAFAFHLVFDSLTLCVLLGLLWGFFILNMDRLIVLTINKNSSIFSQLGSAAIRLAIAALLSLTISKPLELRLFKNEIEYQLEQERMQAGKQAENAADARFP